MAGLDDGLIESGNRDTTGIKYLQIPSVMGQVPRADRVGRYWREVSVMKM